MNASCFYINRRIYHRLIRVSMFTLFITSVISIATSQCTMTCTDTIQFALELPCTDNLQFDDVQPTVSVDCMSPFTVEVVSLDETISYGTTIDQSMIGSIRKYKVYTKDSSNSCWGYLEVVDKQPPVVRCLADVTISCLEKVEDVAILDMTSVDDCSTVSIRYSDAFDVKAPCSSTGINKIITRSYVVEDIYGYTNTTCKQTITVKNVVVTNIEWPMDLVLDNALSCEAYEIDESQTGVPKVNGIALTEIKPGCNVGAFYKDERIATCDGAFKIARRWTVYNSCATITNNEHTQYIEVADKTAPSVKAPADFTIGVNQAHECLATYPLPAAVVVEDCGTTLDYTTTGIFGTIRTNGGLVTNLPLGVHQIIYSAKDGCNNVGKDTLQLTVKDLLPPVAHCHGNKSVSLSGNSQVIVNADVFDLGSYDGCGKIYFKVKRMVKPSYACTTSGNPDYKFDDNIAFCCADVGNSPLMVILRVYEGHVEPGPVNDDYRAGFFTDCMVEVRVQDLVKPIVRCPADMTLDCDVDWSDLTVFGNADSSSDNCGIVSMSEKVDTALTKCNVGSITRTFTATDMQGNSSVCKQVLTFKNNSPFGGSIPEELWWPADIGLTTCAAEVDTSITGSPRIVEDACDLVGVTFKDRIYEVTNACFGVERKWKVIDWCRFDPDAPDLYTSANGYWSHNQYITVSDAIGPILTSPASYAFNNSTGDCSSFQATIPAPTAMDCTPADMLTYSYIVDLFNDDKIDRSGSGSDASGNFPTGQHTITYYISDKCGNTSPVKISIVVLDAKAPQAAIIDHIAVDLNDMGGGNIMAIVQASIFNRSSIDDCDNPEDLVFAFDEAFLELTRNYTCADKGLQDIDIWVKDKAGNKTKVQTQIDIQDNKNLCPNPASGESTSSISGAIMTPLEGMIPGVLVSIESEIDYPIVQVDGSGQYSVTGLKLGKEYLVNPSLDGNAFLGVSVIDLVQIQRHILGIENFDSPYDYIAADINANGTISISDLVELKNVLLHESPYFLNITSWRFVSDDFTFIDGTNPLYQPFDEQYHIDKMSSSMKIDFTGIKIGDVNGSYSSVNTIESRSQHQVEIILPNHIYEAKELMTIPLKIGEDLDISGIEMTFRFLPDEIEILDILSPELTSIGNFDFVIQDSRIKIIFTAQDEYAELAKGNLLYLKARMKSHNALDNVLFLSSENSNIYDSQLVGRQFNLKKEINTNEGFKEVYNRPNPFNRSTEIHFYSDRSQSIKLDIMDVQGQLIYSKVIEGQKGENVVLYSPELLPPSGLYFFKLSSESESIISKMVIAQ